MNNLDRFAAAMTRRHFFGRAAGGLGVAALATLLNGKAGAAESAAPQRLPHMAPRAKRVISLFQSGAPSQIDLFDPKPGLDARFGEELPESIRRGQRLTGMTAHQDRHPV
ncbi:MAG TPA: DUF1501 domain-containing protein, partial [Planctomycetaceae bacterium]|nr:DUF1501 domain-containing protein [Planctomycetaceae bacterium]